MKKLLTIVICGQPEADIKDTIYDGVELVYTRENLAAAVKQSKGKYIIIENRTFLFNDVQPFLEALETATQDIVRFNGGNACKSSLFKGVAENADVFAYCAYAAFNAKNVAYFEYEPFIFSAPEWNYDEDETALLYVCGEFKKIKARLSREVYSFTFDMILDKLIYFYKRSLICIRTKRLSADRLAEFDKNLKDDIVLYLALDKRFENGKLSKIRSKKFKISGITFRRYKKSLKIKDA